MSVVLTLAHRPDRLARFLARWDGPPPQVHTTTTAHGDSYRAVLAGLTADTLVQEDDAILTPGWRDTLAAALDVLPDDWDLLYLGGEHLTPPVPISAGLLRCTHTLRTHAVYVRHTSVPRLLELPGTGPHIDMMLADAMTTRAITAYAISPWVAGQAAGPSDISHIYEPERWWQ